VEADQLDRVVQRLLPPGLDEDVSPSSTNNRAPASAMPVDPPVITATFPSSFPTIIPPCIGSLGASRLVMYTVLFV
jgi:hypothetical protein